MTFAPRTGTLRMALRESIGALSEFTELSGPASVGAELWPGSTGRRPPPWPASVGAESWRPPVAQPLVGTDSDPSTSLPEQMSFWWSQVSPRNAAGRLDFFCIHA